ncbi:hypothetical protein [Psychromonas aquatilis]|uniref:Uncharacterized protein n=1 Tax=Psychromonas aquatilis TaxID=2005072 RepID=A0ABU9GRJ8_9GAMM
MKKELKRNINLSKCFVFIMFVVVVLINTDVVADDYYNDDSCITDIRDAELTGKACKSLDLGVLKHKANYTNKVYEPFYDTNEFIDSETMNTYNKLDKSKNELGTSQSFSKELFKETVYKPYLLLLCLLFFIFTKVRNASNKEVKEDYSDVLAFIVMSFITISILDLTAKTEETTVPIVRTSIELNNYLNRISQTNVMSESNSVDLILNEYSKNESLIDTTDLFKINVCLSNSQKYDLENREVAFNFFNDRKEVVDFYNLKNEPFITNFDERNHRKVAYSLNETGFLNHISFANCGQVLFPSLNVSAELFKTMEAINFKELLHSSIIEKDFEKKVKELKSNYEDKIGEDYNSKQKFVDLLVMFTTEYKKGVLFGSVLTNYELNNINVIERDFTNFTERQIKADEVYNNIVSAQCILNAPFLDKTTVALNSFPSQSNSINQYDCINIVNDDLEVAAIPYVYEENEELVKQKRIQLRDNSLPIAEEEAKSISSEYETVNLIFNEIFSETTDFYKDLAHIYNKGGYSSSEFFTYLHNNANDNSITLAKLIDVNKIDYSKSMPDFNFDKTPVISTNVFTVNSFIKTTLDQIDLEKGQLSTNYANSLIEYSADNSSSNIADELYTDVSSMDFITGLLENNSVIFSTVKKMVCSADKDDCVEIYRDFDGTVEWKNLSNSLNKVGAETLIYSLSASIAISTVDSILNWQKRNGDATQAIFGNQSKAGKISSFTHIGKSAAETMAALSIMSIILGNLMISLFSFQGFVLGWFEQAQIIYLNILPNLIIMVCVISLMTNYTVRSYSKSLSLTLNLFLYPLIAVVAVSIISFFSNYMLITMLDNIPNISSMLLPEKNGSAIDSIFSSIIVISMLILLMIIGNVIIIKVLINGLSKLTTNSFDGAFETAENVINKSQAVIMTSVVGTTLKSTTNRVKSKIKNKIIKENK